MDRIHVGPNCAPTRAGLMTGRHANSTGVWHTIGGRSLLRKDEWTLPQALRENGYASGLFGKWHLGDEFPYRPHDRGFDRAVVHGGGGITQTPDWWGNDYFDDTYFVNGQPLRFSGYCTDVFFEEGLRFIEQHKDSPFFCVIAPNAPHFPFNVPKEYQDLYKDSGEPETYQRFLGMITNIDDNFGRLRERLRDLGLEDNTILIFTSDNGTCGNAWAGRSDPWRAGMRGEKGSEYDGGHRAPFFLRWPGGGISGGRTIEQLTTYIDFMPTLLELCGVELPEGRSFHGASLVPLLRGDASDPLWEERIFVTDSQRVTTPIKWKQSATMKNTWRLVNGTELFDIQSDPAQTTDIAAQHPGIVNELRAGYEAWWEIVSEQFDEEIPVSLGDEPVLLTTHDWRNEQSEAAWNQGLIRQGHVCNGYWEVLIEQDGLYEIELRRWPREAGHRMAAGIDGDDVSWRKEECWENWHFAYTGGKALPIRRARLEITGHQPAEKDVEPDADAVTFFLPLKKGPARLQTWLTGEDGFSIGAYYVYVRMP
jgi:arylsulfatase A-like enzyme